MKKNNTNKNIINLNEKENDDKQEKEKISNKKETKKKKEKENTKETKSKLNIFLLIITLIFVFLYGICIYKSYDANNMMDTIKSIVLLLIGLVIIFVLFKINAKKTTPYVIILSLLLIGYSVFNISYAKSDKTLYIKDFINKDISEVIDFTDKYGLKLITLNEYSDTIEKNHVILQDYGITTLISDVNTLTVTISDGPNYQKEVNVSNLVGFKYDDVMKYIKDNYLSNIQIEFIESDKESDTVINQVGSGTMKRCDLITFTFSKNNEEISVKDLTGLSLFDATSYLKRYNINYEIDYQFNDKIEKDYVIDQDIKDKVCDNIKLIVSKGKEIIVPDILKMSTTEISKWAFSNNIKIKYIEEYNKEYENGKIIKVSEDENNKLEEGNEIIITISKGSLKMPKVTDLAEFKLWASENFVLYEEVYEFSDTIQSGDIITTSHKENDKLTENDTVIITISKGKSVTIPNFIGQSKNTIQTKCNSLGLTCTFKYGSFTESTNKDICLSQSKGNGTVVSSGTNLVITLSSGIYEKVNVPSFTNQTKQQGQTTCNNLGIVCNFTYQNSFSDKAKDTIVSQDKTGTVIKGSTVNITLSQGPAKTYTVIIDGSLLSLGNPEQTKNTLKNLLATKCPGVNFNFTFQPVNSGIGYLNPNSQVKVGSNNLVQGKTYNIIINSN